MTDGIQKKKDKSFKRTKMEAGKGRCQGWMDGENDKGVCVGVGASASVECFSVNR